MYCYSKLVTASKSIKLFGGIWNKNIEIKIEKNKMFSKFEIDKRLIKVFSISIYCNKKMKRENNGFFKVEKDSYIILGWVLFILIKKRLLIDLQLKFAWKVIIILIIVQVSINFYLFNKKPIVILYKILYFLFNKYLLEKVIILLQNFAQAQS